MAAGRNGLPVPAIGPDEAGTIRRKLTKVLTGDAAAAARPDAWEQAAPPHGVATWECAPGELLIEAGTGLAVLEMAITRCRPASPMRRLARVTAQMPGLMCLLFVKPGGRAAFRRRADTARAAAAEAGDARTFSWALAPEVYGYFHGGLPGAVRVARHAQGVVRRTPCVGAALAAALKARAHAARGDTREAQRAPGRAESLLSALDAGWLTGSAFIVTWARDHEHWSPGQRGPGLPRQAHRQPAAGSHWCRRPAACGGGAGW